ncbi:MAG: hypothetical protein ACEY3D_07030 [Rickettsia sp.]
MAMQHFCIGNDNYNRQERRALSHGSSMSFLRKQESSILKLFKSFI